MLVSKVTAKYQATIPGTVRAFLHIKNGDRVKFEIINNQVVVKKVDNNEYDYLKSLSAVMTEWASEDDDEAYNDL